MMTKRKMGNQKFCPLTAKKAREWYQKKYLSTCGYLLVIKEILSSPGVNLQIDNILEFCAEWGISRSAFYRGISQMPTQEKELFGVTDKNYIESQVRERLQSQLGGLTEVKTPAGRIDLLTNTEIIEIKRVNEWKSGLGQILVYAGFYPEHRKRLHLFSNSTDEKQIIDIAASCLAFDVLVSFEKVMTMEAHQ